MGCIHPIHQPNNTNTKRKIEKATLKARARAIPLLGWCGEAETTCDVSVVLDTRIININAAPKLPTMAINAIITKYVMFEIMAGRE